MLELLLYCHTFARLRYAGEIMLVMDFIGDLTTHCRRLVAPAAANRREPVCAFGFLTEHALERLDAYVVSAA
jgi:hypothetical protein